MVVLMESRQDLFPFKRVVVVGLVHAVRVYRAVGVVELFGGGETAELMRRLIIIILVVLVVLARVSNETHLLELIGIGFLAQQLLQLLLLFPFVLLELG